MSIKQIVICDTQKVYVDRLLMRLQQQKERHLSYIGITNPDDFTKEDATSSLYLMAEPFWIPVLLEGIEHRTILLSGDYVPKWLMGYPVINKYQDYQNILRGIFGSELWNDFFAQDNKALQSSLSITGIYSPSAHPDVVYYAISYTKRLQKKSLFIPVLQNGFYIFCSQYEVQKDLLDVLYLMDMKGENFDLRGFIHKVFDVDVILPPFVSGAASRLGREQIVNLLRLVQQRTDYEEVVLCFDCLAEDYYELFDSFSKKILLESNGPYARHAQKQFQENIRLHYGADREDDYVHVELPVTQVYDPDQLCVSEMEERIC
ncbi:hypothetical protein [Eubacterium oxidoreducens]|uniref:Uncharacterized protein n=1 Tax=Eubacterium oxidoreducens TaxID=1732 RepID=A0A1G5ZZX3_EUBOX|nr:hypothetical protein [Eubacterium oxidoreducens]SDB01717.1 hypothetical protein SAMN02910417_00052 [Eubacterium oxidoreducens]